MESKTAVCISVSGGITDIVIPKTNDVLEWIRKKYKNPGFQFQGKLQDPVKESRWLSIFACVSDEDENINSHMLPTPFDEEMYAGNIIILASESEDCENYEKPISKYVSLTSIEYEELYEKWTFNADEMDEIIEEEEEEEIEEEVIPAKPQIKNVTTSKDVFVDCAIREKVVKSYEEILNEKAKEFEECLLKYVKTLAIREEIDIDWGNRVFWNLYRNKAISLYENIIGVKSYVLNDEDWLEKVLQNTISMSAFIEMSAVEMCPARWKSSIENNIVTGKQIGRAHV